MRKELFVHFAFLISFFVLVSLFKKWISLSYWPFWVGGILGTILPDVDHFIYVYFMNPQELTSQRVNSLMQNKDLIGSLNLLADTKYERSGFIFHTTFFQSIFFVLTFLVVSSSGSLFGRGLVLAFSLHLVIDQFVELMQTGSLTNWTQRINFPPIAGLEKEKVVLYWAGALILVLIFGFLL